jgi:hypothetical protein
LVEQQTNHVRKLFTLHLWPTRSVLEEAGERGVLEGLLEVLVPEQVVSGTQPMKGGTTLLLPANQFVEDISVFLHLVDFYWFWSLQNREWRERCTVILVCSSWLKETSDEEDFKESIGILEKLESGACLDEFVCVAVKIAWSDDFKVLVELIAEGCSRILSVGAL